MFEIETGIDVPERTRKGKVEKYPFSNLEPKQSFFVPAEGNEHIVKTVSHAAYGAEKRIKKVLNETRRFTVRAFNQAGVEGARVWRTE